MWTTFRVDGPLPASEAVRIRRPVFITSPDDRDNRYPIFREQPVVQDAAYAIEPLLVGVAECFGRLSRMNWLLHRINYLDAHGRGKKRFARGH